MYDSICSRHCFRKISNEQLVRGVFKKYKTFSMLIYTSGIENRETVCKHDAQD